MLEMEIVVIRALGDDLVAVRASANVLASRRRAARVANKERGDVKETKRDWRVSFESQRRDGRGPPSSLALLSFLDFYSALLQAYRTTYSATLPPGSTSTRSSSDLRRFKNKAARDAQQPSLTMASAPPPVANNGEDAITQIIDVEPETFAAGSVSLEEAYEVDMTLDEIEKGSYQRVSSDRTAGARYTKANIFATPTGRSPIPRRAAAGRRTRFPSDP